MMNWVCLAEFDQRLQELLSQDRHPCPKNANGKRHHEHLYPLVLNFLFFKSIHRAFVGYSCLIGFGYHE